jgi:hypothetical protein
MADCGSQKEGRPGPVPFCNLQSAICDLRLLALAMNGPLPVVPAELLQFQLLGHRLLVLRGGVVAPFALSALERDDFPTCACHVSLRENSVAGALAEI